MGLAMVVEMSDWEEGWKLEEGGLDGMEGGSEGWVVVTVGECVEGLKGRASEEMMVRH